MSQEMIEYIFYGIVFVVVILFLWRWFVNHQLKRAMRRRYFNPNRKVECRFCKYNYVHANGKVDCLKHLVKNVHPKWRCKKFTPREDEYVHY